MPMYEFACDACFKRSIVSTWEMMFKLDEPMNTFCPRCGQPGHQVFLTAPAVIGSERREASKFSDEVLKRELAARGITSIDQKRFDPEEALAAKPHQPDLRDPFAIKSVNPAEALMKGQGASAHARAEAEFLGKNGGDEPKILGGFPERVPTQVVARYDPPEENT